MGRARTTQVQRLAEFLKSKGEQVITTREPGGTKGAEEIRKVFLSAEANNFSVVTDVLLNFAARSEHMGKFITPALEEDKTVICDRFFDSTLVYQGYAGGVDIGLLQNLHELIFDSFYPDVTFVMDIDVDTTMRRALARADKNRFDNKSREYHKKVIEGFHYIADLAPERCNLINGNLPIEVISNKVTEILEKQLTDTL